jgi:hypothetical protein
LDGYGQKGSGVHWATRRIDQSTNTQTISSDLLAAAKKTKVATVAVLIWFCISKMSPRFFQSLGKEVHLYNDRTCDASYRQIDRHTFRELSFCICFESTCNVDIIVSGLSVASEAIYVQSLKYDGEVSEKISKSKQIVKNLRNSETHHFD